LVLGVVGGVLGIIGALVAGEAAFVFCFLGFLGAGLSIAKPRLGSLLLLIAAIGMIISISEVAIGPAPLLLMASLLAFLGRRKKTEADGSRAKQVAMKARNVILMLGLLCIALVSTSAFLLQLVFVTNPYPGISYRDSGPFAAPQDVSVSEKGNIYVADSDNGRIVELSPGGSTLRLWDTNPRHYGYSCLLTTPLLQAYCAQEDDLPTRVLVDRYGNVYVNAHGDECNFADCTWVHDRQEVFSPLGRMLLQVPPDTFLGRDLRGTIYTCATLPIHTLPVRNLSRRLCNEFRRHGIPEYAVVDAHGSVLVSTCASGGKSGGCFQPDANVKTTVMRLSANGKIEGRFGPVPSGTEAGRVYFSSVGRLSLDQRDNIYVVDAGADRIVKLSPSGKTLSVLGRFHSPFGVAVTNQATIYVAELGRNQIDKLSPTGKRIATWAQPN
jgi:hypothetical protein